MASNQNKYWIKLYHEILHDPKMGMLPDHLWRRTIELFLLAGELDDEGNLPDTKELAWSLRRPCDELEQELQELATLGILTRVDSGWLVTNFAKRQAPIDAAERMRAYRERKRRRALAGEKDEGRAEERNEEDNNMVTRSVTQRNADTDIDIDKDSPKGDDKPSPKKARPKNPPTVKQKAAQEMFSALTSVCKIDLKLISSKTRGKFNQAESIMREKGYIPQEIYDFEKWWYANDWRGQRGQPPTLNDIRETWGQFKAGIVTKNGAQNDNKHQRPSRSVQKSARKATGHDLERQPTFNPRTGKIVPPGG